MATVTTAGSGNWSSTTPNAPWPSGTVPTSADDVVIANTHTVTLDTAAVCQSLTVNTGGTLSAAGGAAVSLTVQRGVTQQTGSSISLDFTASYANGCTVTLNNSRAAAASNYRWYATGTATVILKGFVKKRWTTLNGAIVAGATSATVTDATGWQVGDNIVFATTQAYNATPRVDVVTLTSVNTGTGALGWTGGITYDHANTGLVGNFSSNLIVKPPVAGDATAVVLEQNNSTRTGYTRTVTDVEFNGLSSVSTFPSLGLTIGASFAGADGTGSATPYTRVGNNAFWGCTNTGMYFNQGNTPIPRDNNIYYSTAAAQAVATGSTQGYVGDEDDWVVFRSGGGAMASGALFPGVTLTRPKISGCVSTSHPAVALGSSLVMEDADIFSNALAFHTQTGKSRINSSRIGTQYSGAATNSVVFNNAGLHDGILTDCNIQSGGTLHQNITTTIPGHKIVFANKNADAAVQEIYTAQSNTVPAIQRDASTTSRSTSAVLMTCSVSDAVTHSFDVLAKAGETIRIVGLLRKSGTPAYGASTLPKITVSGLGITPVTATMSAGTAADTWETVTLDATNSGSADGLLTVTFTAQSSTAGAKAWFSGIPVAPFVSRCRHYGYLFNETSPTRETDITKSADEATAAAYTGMTITWGASSSSTTISADNTFQKLFDYHQAQACLNVDKAVALTGAGVAGSPSLFAAGAVTINDGFKLNGAGSIAMGSHLLSTEFASGVNYTYTGGTWSQATTVPTFNGGTLNLGAAGTYTFTAAAAMIWSMTPTAPSTYSMGGCTLTGQMDLRNTTAHAITVELPSGASYTTANNTGGAITVTTPQIYQSVTISGAVAGSRIQIYDTTAGTELYNGTPTFPYTWTDGSPAAASRAIRLRCAYVSGVTAKDFLEASIGTCGTTSGTESVSYLVGQTNDTTYNSNAVDGSAVTGITIVEGSTDRVQISIAGGSVSWASIYAYQCYWLFTATGIQDDGAFIDAPDTANYTLTGFKIKNTHATVPLVITGGYGVDSTGSVSALYDTTGTSIFPAPDHVVPYATGSGVTAQDKIDIAAQVLTAAQSSPIHSEIWKVAGSTITGTGTAADPWGP